MTIMELGALGEFLGSIAVLATLVYLSVQIRQNTRSMGESKKLALAQTYQMRSDALQMMLVQAADSEHIGPIISKLTGAGYPEDIGALEQLSKVERQRFHLQTDRCWISRGYRRPRTAFKSGAPAISSMANRTGNALG
jgi:hypothetical protein